MVSPLGDKQPLVVGIGGGKGGVGKSMVCSNLAIAYANAGFRCIIVDLDLGAANVHTIFGMNRPPKGLGEFFSTKSGKLGDFVTNTEIERLQIVAGGAFVPELANLPHPRKVKLVNQIRTLEADIILLDLGAGTSTHVIDFFSMCHSGIVVTTPEPTAVLNAYEFLKNIVFRVLHRMFRNQKPILEQVKKLAKGNSKDDDMTIAHLIDEVAKLNAWSAQNIRDVCDDFDFHLILNQARKVAQADLGVKLHRLCHRFLNLPLRFSGMLFHNEEVSAAVVKMEPVTLAFPDSVTSKALQRIAITTFERMTTKMAGDSPPPDHEADMTNVLAYAQEDFRDNLLTQKRLYREKERLTL